MIISTKKLYSAGKVLTSKQILIDNGKIVSVENYIGNNFDFENLAPALIDIHINGGEKYHFTASPTAEALEDMVTSARKNGVGYVMPALITSSPENIFHAFEVVKDYTNGSTNSGIIGLHLEGPFISVAKRGAHLSKYIISPDDKLLAEIIKKGEGILKMMTIAPENFSDSQIKMLLESGVKISLGHSNCTYKRAQEAFDLGVDLVTHLFNAMSSFHHRELGLLGAALANENVYTPVILDGVHADYDAVKLALKLKGDKMFFISDALFQNHIKQEFVWEEFDAKLIDGNYMNSDGNLAGATISMADCVKNGVEILNLTLEKSLEKSCELPAQIIGLDAGKIEKGCPAAFSSFNSDLEKFAFLSY